MLASSIITIGKLGMVFYLFRWGYWQLNDPDALLWTLIYWIPALLILVSVFKEVPDFLFRIVQFLSLGYFFVVMPKSFETSWMKLEEGREAMGLFIIFIFLVISRYGPDRINKIFSKKPETGDLSQS